MITIGSPERGAPMGDDQAGCLMPFEQLLPQDAFCFDIKRTRQVLEHEQFRVTDEHAGGGRTLELATGELFSSRANDRLHSFVEFLHVRLEDGGPDGVG